MALVKIHTGKKDTKYFEWVVVGDSDKGCKLGDIRHVLWNRYHTSPLLEVDWTSKDRTEVRRVQVAADFEKRGWKLLRDMYKDDPERSQHWGDWLAFCEAQRENKPAMIGREFPEKYLPTKVVEMLAEGKRSAAERNAFVFPSELAAQEAVEFEGASPSAETVKVAAIEAEEKTEKKPSARQRKPSA